MKDMTKKEIAAKLGMSVHQFYRFRKHHNVPDVFTHLTDDQLRHEVNEIIRETNGDLGTKMTYGMLKSKKLTADKARVGKILKELDPEGHKLRTTHKIKRRVYKVSNCVLKDRFHLLFFFSTLMATIN